MPAGWVHAAFDFIVWGRPYFDDHRRKDRWAKILGRWHRRRDHEWYLQFGTAWTFEIPFSNSLVHQLCSLSPFAAESLQVDLSHDYLDSILGLPESAPGPTWSAMAWIMGTTAFPSPIPPKKNNDAIFDFRVIQVFE
jgi:hypothetical protein